MNVENPFDFKNGVSVVTGGAGVLCSPIAIALAGCGANVAILDVNLTAANAVVRRIHELGGTAIAIEANVVEKDSLTCTV